MYIRSKTVVGKTELKRQGNLEKDVGGLYVRSKTVAGKKELKRGNDTLSRHSLTRAARFIAISFLLSRRNEAFIHAEQAWRMPSESAGERVGRVKRA